MTFKCTPGIKWLKLAWRRSDIFIVNLEHVIAGWIHVLLFHIKPRFRLTSLALFLVVPAEIMRKSKKNNE